MSKNNGFGKFIIFCATIGAAAAGVYYYLSKRDAAIAGDFDDEEFDDFEDFEDDDIDTPDFKFGSRKYVDIKSNKSNESSKENNSDASEPDDEELDEEKFNEDLDEEFDKEEETADEPAASKSEEFFNDEA